MDAARFDTLSRERAGAPSRRGLLHGLAAVTLGLLAAHAPSDASARKKRKKGCKRGQEKFNGRCAPRCRGSQVRNPVTRGCCQSNGGSCSPGGANADCCSGLCGAGANTCTGRDALQPCEFAAQCATGSCSPVGLCIFST